MWPAPQVVRPRLLHWLAAFCVLDCVGAAAVSGSSSSPEAQWLPVLLASNSKSGEVEVRRGRQLEVCGACTVDYSVTGVPCCDAAWSSFGWTCADLASQFYWDCSGCNCPGDPSPPPPPPPSPPSPPPPPPPLPSPPPPPPPPPTPPTPPQLPPSCPNTCLGAPEKANNGVCDDGGPGAENSFCAFGTLSATALTLAVIPTPALTLRTHTSYSHHNRSRSPVPCPGWSDEALTLIRYRLQRLQDSHGGSRRQGSRATAPRVHRPARQHVKSAVLVPSDSVSVHK